MLLNTERKQGQDRLYALLLMLTSIMGLLVVCTAPSKQKLIKAN